MDLATLSALASLVLDAPGKAPATRAGWVSHDQDRGETHARSTRGASQARERIGSARSVLSGGKQRSGGHADMVRASGPDTPEGDRADGSADAGPRALSPQPGGGRSRCLRRSERSICAARRWSMSGNPRPARMHNRESGTLLYVMTPLTRRRWTSAADPAGNAYGYEGHRRVIHRARLVGLVLRHIHILYAVDPQPFALMVASSATSSSTRLCSERISSLSWRCVLSRMATVFPAARTSLSAFLSASVSRSHRSAS